MTPQIQKWVKTTARNFIAKPGRVLEIGALNVNGTVRQFFGDADSYIGTDMEAGPNVDIVVNNSELLKHFDTDGSLLQFNTIIACEVLEHDKQFWHTVVMMKTLLKTGGHLIITTPSFGFPEHRYPRHYVNFGKDAYTDIFFEGMEILDLRHLDNAAGKGITLAGIARKL